MHFFVYLDEFGHIGPFISRADRKHKTSPVFGLGGLALPVEHVRSFAVFFYKLKSQLLAWEIKRDAKPAYQWEKKGSSLYRPQNVTSYRNLRLATNRLINEIKKQQGFAFYTGIEKTPPREEHTPHALYCSVLKHAIQRISRFCGNTHTFSLFLDAVDSNDPGGKRVFRLKGIEAAGVAMFGNTHHAPPSFALQEPPYQLESHLYQNMQCADWLCGIFGRRCAYKVLPDSYPDNEPIEKYFGHRLDGILKAHSLRQAHPCAKIISLPN